VACQECLRHNVALGCPRTRSKRKGKRKRVSCFFQLCGAAALGTVSGKLQVDMVYGQDIIRISLPTRTGPDHPQATTEEQNAAHYRADASDTSRGDIAGQTMSPMPRRGRPTGELRWLGSRGSQLGGPGPVKDGHLGRHRLVWPVSHKTTT
jgi:hypothetical protein